MDKENLKDSEPREESKKIISEKIKKEEEIAPLSSQMDGGC